MTMADEYAAYGVPCLHPPCKVSKLKIAKEETDQGSDEVAIESQFLQHKTKGNKLRKILGNNIIFIAILIMLAIDPILYS